MKSKFTDLSYQEMVTKREELQKKLVTVRFDKVLGHIENPLEKRTLRRQIARLNTLIHEYGLGIRK